MEAVESEVDSGPDRNGGRRLAERAEALALPITWLVVIVIFGFLRPESFLTASNLSGILGSQAVLVVASLGLIIVMRAGDFDLSVASTLTLSSMLIAVLNVHHGVPIWLAVLAALLAGACIGAFNGLLVSKVGIHSFIVTLGTATVTQGVILWMSGGITVTGVSESLTNMVVGKRLMGIPLEFYYGLLLTVVVWYFFEFTPVGRRLLFVGRGREVANLSGISVRRVRWTALICCGTVSAFAGALYAGTTGSADPTSGLSYLLPAFASAFLGATSIKPGFFNPWGTTIAVYFLVTGITGLAILGVQTYVQNLFYGGALLIAVTLAQITRGGRAQDLG
jgi:ribose transport system permease protein